MLVDDVVHDCRPFIEVTRAQQARTIATDVLVAGRRQADGPAVHIDVIHRADEVPAGGHGIARARPLQAILGGFVDVDFGGLDGDGIGEVIDNIGEFVIGALRAALDHGHDNLAPAVAGEALAQNYFCAVAGATDTEHGFFAGTVGQFGFVRG